MPQQTTTATPPKMRGAVPPATPSIATTESSAAAAIQSERAVDSAPMDATSPGEAHAASPVAAVEAEADRMKLGAILSSTQDDDVSSANEASRLMRSELVLLLEQATALKEQRMHVEQRRKEMTESVLDSIARLLPPPAQSLVATIGRRSTTVASTTTTNARELQQHQHHSLQRNLSTITTSRSEEASELLYAALNAQKSLHRLKLSCRQQQQQQQQLAAEVVGSPGAGSTPPTDGGGGQQQQQHRPRPTSSVSKAKELIDARALAEKQSLELTVLTQRESLLQHRANALLTEKRDEVQRRDDLMKRRVELRKSVAAAAAAAASLLSPTQLLSLSSSSLPSSTASSSAIAGGIEALTEQRDALKLEWDRLRRAAQERQQPSSTSTSLNASVSAQRLGSTSSSTDGHHLLSWRGTETPAPRPRVPYSEGTDVIGVGAQRWILPEQYLVRSLN